MKNKRITSYNNLLTTPSDPNTSTRLLDARNKRRASSGNSFLKKSSDILQTYKVIFNKPTLHKFGDTDTYFKQSLRNYDDFEINRSYKWNNKPLKPQQSAESLNLTKRKFNSGLLFGQGDTKHKKSTSKPVVGKKHKLEFKLSSQSASLLEESLRVPVIQEELPGEEEDTDLEVFYSPNSQLEESEDPALTEKSSANFDEEKEVALLSAEEVQVDNRDTSLEKMADAEEDDLEDVEKLVEEADSTLNEVVAENPSLQDVLESSRLSEETETAENAETDVDTAIDSDAIDTIGDQAEGGETSETTDADKVVTDSEDEGKRLVGIMDSEVLRELEEAEQQARETANIIYELKQRVSQLLSKAKMTETEAKELELKNIQLKEHMTLFEGKTRRIQFLVNKASLFDNMIPPKQTVSQTPHNEDMLPKVIICGTTENNMPKIIVCDDHKKKHHSHRKPSILPPPTGVMPQFAKRLSESYSMQEKLAAENAELEGKRYRLQEDLLDKDQTVESLQRKVTSLQGELRMVCKENCLLSEKLVKGEPSPKGSQGDSQEQHRQKYHKNMPCGKNKSPCPADVESRLTEYSETTQQLEKQLCSMENEVRAMQCELAAVQKERQHLEQHRKMLTSAPPPCPPPPCAPVPCVPPPCAKPPCQGPCNPNRMSSGNADQQLRELREQYNRLQDDFKSKLTEVAGLRADTEKLKQNAKEAEEARKIAEDKLKEYEKDLKNYKSDKNKFLGSKEQLIEQEQQLNVAKQRFREAQDELEELRALIQDQQAQLDDYRNKYLQAQQTVEEQRRQIDMMEMENNRISEQVNLEIQRVKNQFQEKLQELTPLPDILKSTQLKLQEAQQMHLLAERNNEALVHELQAYRDKAAAMADQIDKVRSDQQLGEDEKASITQRADELERKCNEAEDENERLKAEFARMEEIAEENEKRVQEKLHEIAQLVSQLETVREESARQVARTKDRCETVRRSMQNQIADLERQLAQSRAQARSAQKDRDDIRQKMQSQINNLNENFEDAQMRIRNLQGHVNFLKNSYTTVFPSEGMEGMDACDCGNPY